MPKPERVVIYARGLPDEVKIQQDACIEQLTNAIVSVASDPPDGSDGWISANMMLADGQVDRILMASRRVIPTVIDSLTQHISGRRPRRVATAD